MTVLSELFASLEPGDLLMIPWKRNGTEETLHLQAVVLRREGPMIFISCPHKGLEDWHPYRGNPLLWNKEKNVLTRIDGEVPLWFSDDIQLERGAGAKVADLYVRVPREERVRTRVTKDTVLKFMSTDLSEVIERITLHREAGNVYSQISLVLDLLGLPHNEEQLIGIVRTIHVVGSQIAENEMAELLTDVIVSACQSQHGDDEDERTKPDRRPQGKELH